MSTGVAPNGRQRTKTAAVASSSVVRTVRTRVVVSIARAGKAAVASISRTAGRAPATVYPTASGGMSCGVVVGIGTKAGATGVACDQAVIQLAMQPAMQEVLWSLRCWTVVTQTVRACSPTVPDATV